GGSPPGPESRRLPGRRPRASGDPGRPAGTLSRPAGARPRSARAAQRSPGAGPGLSRAQPGSPRSRPGPSRPCERSARPASGLPQSLRGPDRPARRLSEPLPEPDAHGERRPADKLGPVQWLRAAAKLWPDAKPALQQLWAAVHLRSSSERLWPAPELHPDVWLRPAAQLLRKRTGPLWRGQRLPVRQPRIGQAVRSTGFQCRAEPATRLRPAVLISRSARSLSRFSFTAIPGITGWVIAVNAGGKSCVVCAEGGAGSQRMRPARPERSRPEGGGRRR